MSSTDKDFSFLKNLKMPSFCRSFIGFIKDKMYFFNTEKDTYSEYDENGNLKAEKSLSFESNISKYLELILPDDLAEISSVKRIALNALVLSLLKNIESILLKPNQNMGSHKNNSQQRKPRFYLSLISPNLRNIKSFSSDEKPCAMKNLKSLVASSSTKFIVENMLFQLIDANAELVVGKEKKGFDFFTNESFLNLLETESRLALAFAYYMSTSLNGEEVIDEIYDFTNYEHRLNRESCLPVVRLSLNGIPLESLLRVNRVNYRERFLYKSMLTLFADKLGALFVSGESSAPTVFNFHFTDELRTSLKQFKEDVYSYIEKEGEKGFFFASVTLNDLSRLEYFISKDNTLIEYNVVASLGHRMKDFHVISADVSPQQLEMFVEEVILDDANEDSLCDSIIPSNVDNSSLKRDLGLEDEHGNKIPVGEIKVTETEDGFRFENSVKISE